MKAYLHISFFCSGLCFLIPNLYILHVKAPKANQVFVMHIDIDFLSHNGQYLHIGSGITEYLHGNEEKEQKFKVQI